METNTFECRMCTLDVLRKMTVAMAWSLCFETLN